MYMLFLLVNLFYVTKNVNGFSTNILYCVYFFLKYSYFALFSIFHIMVIFIAAARSLLLYLHYKNLSSF